MRKTSANMRLALLALVISSPLITIGEIQTAHAQSPLSYVTGFTSDIIEVGYSNGQIWALSTNGTIPTAKNYLFEVNSTTLAVQNVYNVTLDNSFSGTGAVGGAGSDLWCSPIYCYYSTVKTTGLNGAVIQVATLTAGSETKGDIVDAYTGFTTLTGTTVKIDGRYLTDGDVTQIFIHSKSASTTGAVQQIDGLSMTLSQSISTTPSASSVVGDVYFFAPTVTEWHSFAGQTVAGSATVGKVQDLFTSSAECTISSSGTSTQTGANFMSYHGTSNNPWLGMTPSFTNYPTGLIGYLQYTNGTAISFYQRTGSPSCDTAFSQNILMSSLDLANVGVRTALASEQSELLFVQEVGANARISVVSWDGTTGTISGDPIVYNTNPAVSQTAINGEFVIIPVLEYIMVPETGAGRRIVILDYSSLAPTPPTPPSDTNLPPESITDVIGGLLCTSGLIAPDQCDPDTGRPLNGDAETNGSGLFLTWFLFIFTGGIMVGVSRKFTFSLTNIPAEFWLGLVVLIIGISWYLNWIPDILFYGIIVGLAGLFAFGLYRSMGKGSGS